MAEPTVNWNKYSNKAYDEASRLKKLRDEMTHSQRPSLAESPNRVEEQIASPTVAVEAAIQEESGGTDYVFPTGLVTDGASDCGPYLQISCYKYKRGYRSLNEIGEASPKERYYSIKLPLPQIISQEYTADTEQFNGSAVYDLASGAAADAGGGEILSSVFGAGAGSAVMALKQGLSRFMMGTGNMTFQTLANAAGAQRNLISSGVGMSINPRYEVVFNSMNIRTHSFDFNLVPTSAEEAKIIKDLVQKLRISSHPTPIGEEIKFAYTYPDEFVITFHDADGARIPEIPYIPDCIIRDLGVAHTTGRLHTDGSPIATRLTLQFQELRALDRDDIKRLGG